MVSARFLAWAFVTITTLACVAYLERERATVTSDVIHTSFGDLTVLNAEAAQNEGPLVLLAHGFAGSRQMMQYIARDLARAGATAAMFDFYGHGRNDVLLSPEVTRIDGTTADLVSQSRTMIEVLRDTYSREAPISLIGHSMATDVMIRTAQNVENVDRVVTISMYSDAVSSVFPEKLLMISGEWENRLRAVALDRLGQLTETAKEGVTVRAGGLERRAVAIPNTEHVAVLFARATRVEIRSWLGLDAGREFRWIGPALVAVFAGIIVLCYPLFTILPAQLPKAQVPLTLWQTGFAILVPTAAAIAIGVGLQGALLGVAGLAGVFGFFAAYGGVGLIALTWAGRRISKPSFIAVVLFLLWGVIVFAFVLDRYGASFAVSGVRAVLFLALLVVCIPFMIADRLIVAQAPVWIRIAARLAVLTGLTLCAFLAPQSWGLVFTVVPVMLLFYLVYGTMGHVLAGRVGATTAGIGQGIVLAWAVAASTPLFAG